MDKEKLSNVIGFVALGNYLSDWDSDKSYSEIQETLGAIKDWSQTEDVTVWDKFEWESPERVSEYIQNQFDSVKEAFETVLSSLDEGATVKELIELLKSL